MPRFRESPHPPATESPDQAAHEGPLIGVERFDRDDGTPVVHLDAGDIVAFVYTAPNHPGRASGGWPMPVVFDLHRRTETADQRLTVLLDGAPARLIGLDTSRFTVRAAPLWSSSAGLTCGRCAITIAVAEARLDLLLDAALTHTCEPGAASAA